MPKFKVGDRVRVQPYSYRVEITGTIINVRGQYCLYDVALDKPFLESMLRVSLLLLRRIRLRLSSM